MGKIQKEHIDNFFKLKKTGNKGWYSTKCPYCGKEDHLGINFGGRAGSFNCFKCGEHGNLYKLLKYIGKQDLIDELGGIDVEIKLEKKLKRIEDEEFKFEIMHKAKKPLGFKRIYEHKYITDIRGIDKKVFEVHKIGTTSIYTKLKNYLIFLLELDNEPVAWIARTTLLNKQIEKKEQKTGKKYRRYLNSPGADFSKYLFGINELDNVDTVIITEGIFDKLKVDTHLQLFYDNELKSVACFGKKISKSQIYLLQQKNVKSVILLYDRDAIKESKNYSVELQKYFNVKVALSTAKDPGDMTLEQLLQTLDKLYEPEEFFYETINKKKLI